ncbi:MAG: hypothetical protein PWQ91_1018 [Eubacteriales bacterium]|nr:hypothetical protein [Eubacteriales bacterium]MDN5363957.1 hypothetical protein [Eubacteriales bacterium]
MLAGLYYRFFQFCRALTAPVKWRKLNPVYLDPYLSQAEKELFLSLDPITGCHSLRVAATIIKNYNRLPAEIDPVFAVKCALLHDIGKLASRPGIFLRVTAVLWRKLCRLFSRPVEKAPSFLGPKNQKKLRAYYRHAALGASLLAAKGGDPVLIWVVANHHTQLPPPPPTGAERAEALLRLLQEADRKN